MTIRFARIALLLGIFTPAKIGFATLREIFREMSLLRSLVLNYLFPLPFDNLESGIIGAISKNNNFFDKKFRFASPIGCFFDRCSSQRSLGPFPKNMFFLMKNGYAALSGHFSIDGPPSLRGRTRKGWGSRQSAPLGSPISTSLPRTQRSGTDFYGDLVHSLR